MRLIDADKVRTIIVDEMWNVDDLPHDEQQAVIKACYSIWEQIEKRASTVGAIPIEWFKEWEGYEQGMAIVNLKDIVEYWERKNGRD